MRVVNIGLFCLLCTVSSLFAAIPESLVAEVEGLGPDQAIFVCRIYEIGSAEVVRLDGRTRTMSKMAVEVMEVLHGSAANLQYVYDLNVFTRSHDGEWRADVVAGSNWFKVGDVALLITRLYNSARDVETGVGVQKVVAVYYLNDKSASLGAQLFRMHSQLVADWSDIARTADSPADLHEAIVRTEEFAGFTLGDVINVLQYMEMEGE